MMDPSDYEQMIRKLAWGCLKRLPQASYLTLDDLIQEGWIVYIKLTRKRFKPERGTKFSTLLYASLVCRYQNIVRAGYQKGRDLPMMKGIHESIIDEEQLTQEQAYTRKETIEKVSAINPELADLLTNGVSPELLYYARHCARVRAASNSKRKVGAISFTKGIIEDFFCCNIDRIIEKIHSDNLKPKIKRVVYNRTDNPNE